MRRSSRPQGACASWWWTRRITSAWRGRGSVRPYAAIGAALAKLGVGRDAASAASADGSGRPAVLALTATADDEAAAAIERELPLDACVLDETDRPNLQVDDQRNLRNRDDYLANLVATGEKTVVYVNSREQSVTVARALRKRVPQAAPLIGFYNAGLSRSERKRHRGLVPHRRAQRAGGTSAFGEGVDIPNIRHVVLYHLPSTR